MSLIINNLELNEKNIVIIEDDLPSIKYYETLLKNSGANIRIFTNGMEFVDYIKNSDVVVDLLFVDFLVPLVNGIDCVRCFRKTYKGIPVIMITAYSSEQAKTEAFVAGCDEYVLKPLYPEKIFFLLEKYLKSGVRVVV